jgi:hypothetical protein
MPVGTEPEGPLPTTEPFIGRPDQSASRWLKSIELYDWTSYKKLLAFVDTRLGGPAADWAD